MDDIESGRRIKSDKMYLFRLSIGVSAPISLKRRKNKHEKRLAPRQGRYHKDVRLDVLYVDYNIRTKRPDTRDEFLGNLDHGLEAIYQC